MVIVLTPRLEVLARQRQNVITQTTTDLTNTQFPTTIKSNGIILQNIQIRSRQSITQTVRRNLKIVEDTFL